MAQQLAKEEEARTADRDLLLHAGAAAQTVFALCRRVGGAMLALWRLSLSHPAVRHMWRAQRSSQQADTVRFRRTKLLQWAWHAFVAAEGLLKSQQEALRDEVALVTAARRDVQVERGELASAWGRGTSSSSSSRSGSGTPSHSLRQCDRRLARLDTELQALNQRIQIARSTTTTTS